ncbi:MAG: hypothetical protein ACKOC0_15260 [Cytophagales bacterium]
MEEFRTSIFEKTKEKILKRLMFNISIFGAIAGIWALYFGGFPLVGVKTAITFSLALLGFKIYEDKYMGITAYGERKAKLVIAEEYIEIRDVRIPYSELTNLAIFVEEYLGMPREIFGVHHGGNNYIEFERKGKSVSIQFVIKNKQDFERVCRLVDKIERNPHLQRSLKYLPFNP